MSPEDFKRIGDRALVSVAAGHDCYWRPEEGLLPPSLWEDLRVELQRRYRRSTGETMAVLTIANNPSPQPTSTLSPHIEGENDGGGR